jgi:hypothetical protein
MKLEIVLFVVAAFFIVDTYYDNIFTRKISSYTKYFKVAAVIFGVFSVYMFMKKNPAESTSLLKHVNGMIQYMPIDRSSKDLITPFFNDSGFLPRSEQRVMASGTEATSRSVSGTKKKYVAANQGWRCNGCNTQLDAWYEVDHKVRLSDGGSNHISNLVALCRNCHGKKTTLEVL